MAPEVFLHTLPFRFYLSGNMDISLPLEERQFPLQLLEACKPKWIEARAANLTARFMLMSAVAEPAIFG